MPAVITICLVIATVALVSLAIVTIRTMIRFEKMAEQIEKTAVLFSESMIEVKIATHEIHEVVASLDQAIDPLRQAAKDLGRVGSRAADMSSAVLQELAVPVWNAIGVVRGVRSGARYFAHLMANRRRVRTGGSRRDPS